MFIDTHAHLYLEHFGNDIEKVVHDARLKDIDQIYLPNIDSFTTVQLNMLKKKFPEMFSVMIGLHPGSVKDDYEKELSHVSEELAKGKYVGLGEIGIDLYWDVSFKKEQIIAFKRQIEWAMEYDLPVIIHARNSLDLTIDIISDYQNGKLRGIFHCFTGTIDQAERIMNLNFLMGIGGIITYKNAGLKETVRHIALDFLVLETDSPYLPPVPHRGRRNESSYIPIIAQHIGDAHGCTTAEVAEATTNNAYIIFDRE